MLAYGTPRSAAGQSNGIGGHTAKLVDALVRADHYEMDADTRCVYFDCVSHLVGRASDSLTNNDMRLLMPPLLDAWKSQTWDPTMDAKKTASSLDPDHGIVPFSVTLGIIATYGKSTLYAPFAECVFEKACTDIKGCVFTRESSYSFSAS